MKQKFLILSFMIIFCLCFSACNTTETASQAPTDSEMESIIDQAVTLQTEGGTYQADDFDVTELKKGDLIYGMLPGQSAFYTSEATVEEAGGSYVKMYQLLQMLPHPEYGYRTQVGTYEVQQDIWVATGLCIVNSEVSGQFTGDGGGAQFVVPDFDTNLKLISTEDLHE
ncbi:hypothetical protein Q5O24_00890 [Eubacteriaceae bacterium ES3]|nr:hypothetical protein Q5O24_00890 [Eubacteriaceae bacterium ES3]